MQPKSNVQQRHDEALLLGINDERLRRKLFEESEDLTLENATKKCKISESSQADLKTTKTEGEIAQSIASTPPHKQKP